MSETDEETQPFAVPSRPASAEETRQAELRRAYEERQAVLERQAISIKEQFGAQLEKVIVAAGVDDAEVRALAVDHMAQSIAERGVTPNQMSLKDLGRLGDQSVEHAYKAYEAHQEQQGSALPIADQHQRDPMQGIEPHAPNYGELRETHQQVAAQEAVSPTEQRSGAIAQGEPRNDARAYSDEIWFNALDRYEDLTARLAEQDGQASAESRQVGLDPLQPAEIQDHGPAETHHAKVDRVAEFLKIDRADREAKKAALQELGKAAGKELTEHEGMDMARDMGGGISL